MQPEVMDPVGRGRRLLWLGAMALAFIVVFLGLQIVAAVLGLQPLAAAALGQVGILAVGIAFALADGDGIRSLGILGKWQGYDLAIIIGIITTNLLGSLIMSAVIASAGQMESMEKQAAGALIKAFGSYDTPTFMLIALGLAALSGVGEELLFRGYVITRLERLGLTAWPTILTSALIFGLVHWPGYGFLPSMSKAIWFGIPTGIFFWRRRSLGPLMAAHGLMNFLGFAAVHLALKVFPGLPGF